MKGEEYQSTEESMKPNVGQAFGTHCTVTSSIATFLVGRVSSPAFFVCLFVFAPKQNVCTKPVTAVVSHNDINPLPRHAL